MYKLLIKLEVYLMNVSGKNSTLIIGIGNPLRSDDGLGWIVAHQLMQEGEMDCDICAAHQLTPELAQQVAFAEKVIIIDASREGIPGELRIYPFSPDKREYVLIRGTHAITIEELTLLAECLYGRCAPVIVVTMAGADFSIGEQFSAMIAPKISRVKAAVRELYAGDVLVS